MYRWRPICMVAKPMNIQPPMADAWAKECTTAKAIPKRTPGNSHLAVSMRYLATATGTITPCGRNA